MVTLTKVVRRKVTTLHGQDLVIELTPAGLVIREPRRRHHFLLPYGVAWQQAVVIKVDADRRARKARRGTR